MQFGVDLATGALELKMLSPFWVAGKVASNGTVLSASGRHSFMVARLAAGVCKITWTTTHPLGRHYIYTVNQELGDSFTLHSMTEDGRESSTMMQARFTTFQNSSADTEFSFTVLA